MRARFLFALLLMLMGSVGVGQWRIATASPVTSGASLSIIGPSFGAQERAVAFAGVMQASGVPAYVRMLPDARRFEVLMGPYVSSDEAEAAQRALARRGLGDTRLLVDDSIRREPTAPLLSWWGAAPAEGQPRVVTAAAPGMLSVVFEMAEAPREVLSQRAGPSTLDVDVEPVSGVDHERWIAPAGTLLLKSIALEGADAGRARFRLTVPPEAQSRVRLEGRRVYVDLAWPQVPWPAGGRVGSRSDPGLAPVRTRSVSGSQPGPAPDLELAAAIERFRQVQPFLLSAVAAPEAAVLDALSQTLADLRGSLVPHDAHSQSGRVRAAIELARVAALPGFSGDRGVEARRAIALFEEAATGSE